MKLSNAIRILMGIIYIFGAATNLIFALSNPQIYADFAAFSIIPFYKTFWAEIVMPNVTTWILLVAAFEMVMALLILSKGKLVKIGLCGVIAFNLVLIPFWWFGWALINLAMALVQMFLLRLEYRFSVVQLFHKKTE